MILITPATGDEPEEVLLRQYRRQQGEQHHCYEDAGQPAEQEPHAGGFRLGRKQHQDRRDDRYRADRDTDCQRQDFADD